MSATKTAIKRTDNSVADIYAGHNKNEGKKVLAHYHYQTYCGENRCEEYLTDAPFKFCGILPEMPLMSTSANMVTYFSTPITKSIYKEKNKYYLHIKNPLIVGNILKLRGDSNPHYYLKSKKMRRDNYGRWVVQICRLDGSELVDLDLKRLVKGKTLIVTGLLSMKEKR